MQANWLTVLHWQDALSVRMRRIEHNVRTTNENLVQRVDTFEDNITEQIRDIKELIGKTHSTVHSAAVSPSPSQLLDVPTRTCPDARMPTTPLASQRQLSLGSMASQFLTTKTSALHASVTRPFNLTRRRCPTLPPSTSQRTLTGYAVNGRAPLC
jgi:enoyl-[acyl-carrier-protein] reductase (NADH)